MCPFKISAIVQNNIALKTHHESKHPKNTFLECFEDLTATKNATKPVAAPQYKPDKAPGVKKKKKKRK